MRYAIMSDGKGTRWNNYMNTTKQTISINGENLLQRTIRLLHENEIYDILIMSHDRRHWINGVKHVESSFSKPLGKMFAFDYLEEPTTFLYGDTFYSDEALKKIINTDTKDICFFGTEKTLVAVKVIDVNLFKTRLMNINDENCNIYRLFADDNSRFVYVESEFYNINTPDDYHILVKKLKKEINNGENNCKF